MKKVMILLVLLGLSACSGCGGVPGVAKVKDDQGKITRIGWLPLGTGGSRLIVFQLDTTGETWYQCKCESMYGEYRPSEGARDEKLRFLIASLEKGDEVRVYWRETESAGINNVKDLSLPGKKPPEKVADR